MTHRPALLSLVLLVTTLALAPQPARADRAAPLPTLQGEAALAHLRREGLDGPLAEALTAAATQQAYLKASNTGDFDQLGYSVAISGDTIVVGARNEDSNATGVDGDQSNNAAGDSGAAYVFVRSGGAWSQQAYLKPSDTLSLQQFGWSVAISGDTIVVGSTGQASNADGVPGTAPFSGAAYVFVRSAGVWTQQAYLKASNTDIFDQFGQSVAISGDTIVVGMEGEDSNATGVDGDSEDNSAVDSGAAYVFVRNAGVWSQQAYLKASNTGTGDQFGYRVAISGDTIVVGARFEDSNATGVDGDPSNDSAGDSGAAYVFVRSASAWSQQAYLKASNTGGDDQFGTSVAISGDTLVVGAEGEDSSATGVDGDQADDSAAPFAGAAYVFVRSAGAWSQQAYLKASNTGPVEPFGYSVAISGDILVVGSRFESSDATGVDGDQSNNGAAHSGAAYVFVRSAGAWSQHAYLKASNAGINDEFGSSVAISGDTLVAGAPFEASNATGVNGDQSNNSASGFGAAYVFVASGADLEMAKIADISDPDPGDTVVFTLTVTNQGPDGATGVTVTDTLPAGLTYVSNDCGATFASPTLTWTIGALADLASATCHLTVTVDAGASATIVNTATVDGNEFDFQIDDNDDDALLAVDLTGYYTLPPCRLVDTRLADGPLGGPALAANVARDFVLAGACGIPADAVAVVLTVTAAGPTTAGNLQIYAAGGSVYYGAGVTRAGNSVVALGAGGALTALAEQPAGTVHLILDVAGYFLSKTGGAGAGEADAGVR